MWDDVAEDKWEHYNSAPGRESGYGREFKDFQEGLGKSRPINYCMKCKQYSDMLVKHRCPVS
jgi:hypothetical protein